MIGKALHTYFSRRVAWPLLYGPWRPESRLAGRYHSRKRELAALPLETRQLRADRKLAELLAWAGNTVPYWREQFAAAGIDPAGIKAPRDVLSRLTVTTREILQQQPENLRSERWRNFSPRLNYSGGSTGTPVAFYSDREMRARAAASAWYADSAAGWFPGADTAILWGADREVRSRRSPLGRLKLFARNTRMYNTFATTGDDLLAAHAELNRRPPEVLIGYAGSLHLIARLLTERGERARYPQRGVISSAETLTSAMRETIGGVFGAEKVFNRYGCREVSLIAHECARHTGLHVNIDDLVVEIVDESGSPAAPGTTGRVLVTSLHHRALPLIRYELGDMAAWSDRRCDCGDCSPLLETVKGRSSDTIRTSGGRLIHGEYFTHLFYGNTQVRQFQFVQAAPDSYVLRYIAAGPLPVEQETRLRRELAGQLGDAAEVEFEHCEAIDPSPSGKYKFTLSLLGENSDE